MSERVTVLVMDHQVPGSERSWRARERGSFGTIGQAVILLGQVEDGRWYVKRLQHRVTGPFRVELYRSEEDAETVARAVMAEVEPRLLEAGYLRWEAV